MKSETIVVLGAGVIGLDVALALAEKGLAKYTTIIAEHLPGDTSVNYTSPWAGANFSAISSSDQKALRWDKIGYKYLLRLAAQNGTRAFVQKTTSTEYWDEMPSQEKLNSMADYLKDFCVIPKTDLPEGVAFGVKFTTVTLNAPMHIRYLIEKLRLDYGIQVLRKKIPDIQSAFLSQDTQLVFNCTGNGARVLPGVEDSKCFPTRGQVVLARAGHVNRNIMRHGKDYETYIIPRPGSNGNVILGGFMQKGVSTGDTFKEETESILSRTKALLPDLNSPMTEPLAVFAGLRPSREGGARVAMEEIALNFGKRKGVIVHNYGAGGTGFQAGYGMAIEAVQTAEGVLQSILSSSERSRSRL
ncbi:D-amino-acid oxidase [Penicillium riverlandense]|uniref:D-amino-acid oxidase n=1 Tax=Penicillium riverlandense TaxID=1903569 RepID=UPI002546E60A|nr:D-amino-acid oxidase [Penicillium riverlandense]KAJ5805207.1 D-amino-acid oxidase [Penicillium riverlandense]